MVAVGKKGEQLQFGFKALIGQSGKSRVKESSRQKRTQEIGNGDVVRVGNGRGLDGNERWTGNGSKQRLTAVEKQASKQEVRGEEKILRESTVLEAAEEEEAGGRGRQKVVAEGQGLNEASRIVRPRGEVRVVERPVSRRRVAEGRRRGETVAKFVERSRVPAQRLVGQRKERIFESKKHVRQAIGEEERLVGEANLIGINAEYRSGQDRTKGFGRDGRFGPAACERPANGSIEKRTLEAPEELFAILGQGRHRRKRGEIRGGRADEGREVVEREEPLGSLLSNLSKGLEEGFAKSFALQVGGQIAGFGRVEESVESIRGRSGRRNVGDDRLGRGRTHGGRRRTVAATEEDVDEGGFDVGFGFGEKLTEVEFSVGGEFAIDVAE